MQIAVHVTDAKLVAVNVEKQLGDFGRVRLFGLFVAAEGVAGAPVPKFDHTLDWDLDLESFI